MAKESGRSLVSETYEQLRGEIIGGHFLPGSRLRLSELAAEHGVSLGVIREAVTRLASEQLLESSPQQGFRMPLVSVPDVEDLAWLRVHLETLALREAISRGTLQWESDLVAAHHALAGTPPRLPDGSFNPEFTVVHSAFHAALIAGCRRPRLLRVCRQYFDSAELYRNWASEVEEITPAMVAAEHQALLTATLDRDPEVAVELLSAHITRTASRLAEKADEINHREAEPADSPSTVGGPAD